MPHLSKESGGSRMTKPKALATTPHSKKSLVTRQPCDRCYYKNGELKVPCAEHVQPLSYSSQGTDTPKKKEEAEKQYRFFWRVCTYPWGDHTGEVVASNTKDAKRIIKHLVEDMYNYTYTELDLSRIEIDKIIEESSIQKVNNEK